MTLPATPQLDTALAFARGGDGLLSANCTTDRDIMVIEWDLGTGQPPDSTLRLGHTKPVYALAVSPAGTALVSSRDDGRALVWRLPFVPEERKPDAAGYAGRPVTAASLLG